MSTYVLMKILESAPRRYRTGIRLLTLGAVDKAYDRLAERIQPRWRVLDVGCGAGALTLRALRRGARVKGVDVNPAMLDMARESVRRAGLEESVIFVEMGVAELDGEEEGAYDAVTTGLCLSELDEGERAYALRQAMRVLKPGGLLLVGDEVVPEKPIYRFLNALIRLPLVAVTWAVTQQTTHPIRKLGERLAESGFRVESVRASAMQTFCEWVAVKPGAAE